MPDKDAIQDMDMIQRSAMDDCSTCIQGTMTDTPMPSTTHEEVRPGEVIHTDVAAMNVPSIGGARYFVSFIDEVSGHVKALPMNSKGQASELLKRQVS